MTFSPHQLGHQIATVSKTQYYEQKLGNATVKVKRAILNHDNDTEIRDIDPVGTPAFGSSVDFLLNDRGFNLTSIGVRMNLGALTSGWSGGSFDRLGPLLGCIIQRVEIYANDGSVQLQVIDGQALTVLDELYYGDQDSAIYAAAAVPASAGAVDLMTPLPTFLDSMTAGLPLYALQGAIRIRITLRNLRDSIVHDRTTTTATPTCAITNFQLRLHLENPPLSAKQTILNAHAGNNPVAYRASFPVVSNIDITNGSTTPSKQLTSVIGPITHMCFYVQPQATPIQNQLLIANAVALTSFELKSSTGEQLTGKSPVSDRTCRLYLMPTNWKFKGDGYRTQNIYAYSWAEDPQDTFELGNNSGNHMFSGSETFTLNYATIGQASQCAVIQYQLRWIEIQRGQIKVL